MRGIMKLSDQLKKYRVLNKFTQEDLAQHIHINRQAISRWENDLSEPDLTTLKNMADLYNIQLEELVNGNIYDYETKHNQLKFYYFLSILSFIIPLGFISLFIRQTAHHFSCTIKKINFCYSVRINK